VTNVDIPVETTSTENSITGLDKYKRSLQIANQCLDKNEIQINEMDKRLDVALELKSNGKWEEARSIYSEIVIQCIGTLVITNLTNPLLREAVWGLLTNCPASDSHDILLVASSRPGRVAAQHQLGVSYFEAPDKNELIGCNLLINAADKNYAPALNSLIDFANKGSEHAKSALLELIYKRPQLASQIIEKQLDIDIKDEFLKKQMMQAVAEGEQGNKYAIELIEEYALQHELFALYFFTEQKGKGKECAINEKTKEEVSLAIEFLKEDTNAEPANNANNNNANGECVIS